MNTDTARPCTPALRAEITCSGIVVYYTAPRKGAYANPPGMPPKIRPDPVMSDKP
jgi:hypothetical protein